MKYEDLELQGKWREGAKLRKILHQQIKPKYNS